MAVTYEKLWKLLREKGIKKIELHGKISCVKELIESVD